MMDNIERSPEEMADFLAERLDQLLPPDSDHIATGNTSESDSGLDLPLAAALELAHAPKLTLSDDALARIQARMEDVPLQPASRPVLRPAFLIAIAAAVLFFVVIGAGLLAAIRNGQGQGDDGSKIAGVASATATSAAATITSTADALITGVTETRAAVIAATVSPTSTPVESAATATETRVPPTIVQETPLPVVTLPASVVPAATTTATPVAVVIMLEGPIKKIEENILTVYDFRVQLKPDDPLLKVLRVEDYVRIEGILTEQDSKLTILASTLELDSAEEGSIVTEIYISPDHEEAWRDPGDCSNPPPPWAPAKGWHQRCDPGGSGGNGNNGSGNGNNGNGNGNGNGKDTGKKTGKGNAGNGGN